MKPNSNADMVCRLKQYSMVAGVVIAPSFLGAEIIYNDISDLIIDEGHQGLDIDANGDVDFVFDVDYWVFGVPMAWMSGNRYGYGDPSNALMGFRGTSLGLQYFVSALDPGDRVSAGQQWVYAYPDIVSYYYFPMLAFDWGGWGAQGEFLDAQPHIAGVRFMGDDGLHYGWVRLQVALYPTSISILDYAYEADVETPIRAGETDGCFTPEAVGSGVVTAESARVHWRTVGSADYYVVRYKPETDSVWIYRATDAPKTYRVLRSLNCGTAYAWQVQAICADGSATAFSPAQYFTTWSCRLAAEDLEVNAPVVYQTTDQLIVQSAVNEMAPVAVLVYDLTGRECAMEQGEGTINIPTGDWPAGMYIIQVQDGEKLFEHKVLITR